MFDLDWWVCWLKRQRQQRQCVMKRMRGQDEKNAVERILRSSESEFLFWQLIGFLVRFKLRSVPKYTFSAKKYPQSDKFGFIFKIFNIYFEATRMFVCAGRTIISMSLSNMKSKKGIAQPNEIYFANTRIYKHRKELIAIHLLGRKKRFIIIQELCLAKCKRVEKKTIFIIRQ